MWQPQRLTTLWAFMACYRDSFTLYQFALKDKIILAKKNCLIISEVRQVNYFSETYKPGQYRVAPQ
jgi:hypothetical protein